MSHKATNWAIQQRGLKPAVKLVLWHLCDRHNPDIGCFPSQAQLAADVEVSRSGLNLHLDELEGAGLIRRIRRLDPATRRQLPTRYLLGFEEGFEPAPGAQSAGGEAAGVEAFDPEPSLDFGLGIDAQSGPEPSPEIGLGPSPKNPESRVQNLDSNPVREPVKEEEVRARGREAASLPQADGQASAGAVPPPDPGPPDPNDGFEGFFRELLRTIGHDPDGPLPGWWQGWPARAHVRRWKEELGFGEARILEIAKASRRSRPEPPDGPKALDADMARARKAMLDRSSKLSGKGASKGGKSAAAAPAGKPITDLPAFWAEVVNSDRYLPVSSISNTIRDAMLARGLVTPDRLRERGVR